jgi:N-acyl-D-aspartate/D-glutamate deacylase
MKLTAPAVRAKGLLKEGKDTDIVVFDQETIADHATEEKPSEPSGGRQVFGSCGHYR